MSNIKITVGGPMGDDASRAFADAWHRAESGETFRERHLAFESWDALARLLTTPRVALLHYVRRHTITSIQSLAKALGRDFREVCGDVEALTGVGLLEVCGDGVRADYDAIETRIAI